MRINRYEQNTLEQVTGQFAGNDDVFYTRNMSATGRFSLANAAVAAGVSTDELMAVLDYRTRRAAQRQQTAQTEQVEEVFEMAA